MLYDFCWRTETYKYQFSPTSSSVIFISNGKQRIQPEYVDIHHHHRLCTLKMWKLKWNEEWMYHDNSQNFISSCKIIKRITEKTKNPPHRLIKMEQCNAVVALSMWNEWLQGNAKANDNKENFLIKWIPFLVYKVILIQYFNEFSWLNKIVWLYMLVLISYMNGTK